MALLLMDGFETAPVLKPGTVSSTGTNTAVTGRDGVGKGCIGAFSGDLNVSVPGAPSALVVGFGVSFKINSFGTPSYAWPTLIATDGTSHLSVNPATNGQLQLRRGAAGGTILATSTQSVLTDTWYFIEMQATIADTGGICVVRVNGQEWINYTGDTRSGGTSTQFGTVRIGHGNGYVAGLDDLYLLDTTGSAPYNTFLGDVGIKAITPNGNGAASQWVGSDGDSVDNYALVDEQPWNSTDYVGSDAAGDRDLYACSDLGISGTVHAVQVNAYASMSDTGTRSLRTLVRDAGGTVAASPDLALSTSWAAVQGPIRTTDAAGSPWTIASVNSHQYGIEVV